MALYDQLSIRAGACEHWTSSPFGGKRDLQRGVTEYSRNHVVAFFSRHIVNVMDRAGQG